MIWEIAGGILVAAFILYLLKWLWSSASPIFDEASLFIKLDTKNDVEAHYKEIRSYLTTDPADFAWLSLRRSGHVTRKEHISRLLMPWCEVERTRQFRSKLRDEGQRHLLRHSRGLLNADPVSYAWSLAQTCGAITDDEYLSRCLKDWNEFWRWKAS